MKRYILSIVLILSLFLVAAQAAVELPDELRGYLTIAAGIAATFILTQLAKVLKTDLSGWQSQLTAAFVTSVMVVINALFEKIPANFEGIATAFMQLIVVLLGSFGLYRVLNKPKPTL